MELLTTKITVKTWGIKKEQYLHYSFFYPLENNTRYSQGYNSSPKPVFKVSYTNVIQIAVVTIMYSATNG
jgi:hypothetical protein